MVGATVPGVPTRHRSRFEVRSGQRVFAKLASDARESEELRREARMLQVLDAELPATSALAPACLGWSGAHRALYLEAIDGEDLERRTRETGLLDTASAAAVGAALATLHQEGRNVAEEVPVASLAPIPVHRPTPADNHHYSAGALDVLIHLQKERSLCAHLDRLCVRAQPETLIHGDVRLDNVLVSATGVRLVDWEFAGAGEAAWDVAQFIASCLGAWLRSIPHVPHVPPARLQGEASVPLAAIRPGLASFVSAYAERSGHDPAAWLSRCLDLAAVRLVRLAVDEAADAEDLRPVSVLHLQVAQNLLERPDEAATVLLGQSLTPRG